MSCNLILYIDELIIQILHCFIFSCFEGQLSWKIVFEGVKQCLNFHRSYTTPGKGKHILKYNITCWVDVPFIVLGRYKLNSN